jgi:hypothetical protein
VGADGAVWIRPPTCDEHDSPEAPSTTIGAAIEDRQPWRRAISAASPEASSYPSMRAGFPVSATIESRVRPPIADRVAGHEPFEVEIDGAGSTSMS